MTPDIHYEKREIIGERLELLKGPFYWLGPDLTLRLRLLRGAARGVPLLQLRHGFDSAAALAVLHFPGRTSACGGAGAARVAWVL